jgi:hypothetical protein
LEENTEMLKTEMLKIDEDKECQLSAFNIQNPSFKITNGGIVIVLAMVISHATTPAQEREEHIHQSESIFHDSKIQMSAQPSGNEHRTEYRCQRDKGAAPEKSSLRL